MFTCRRVAWLNEERLHGELPDTTPAEVEGADYLDLDLARAARENEPNEHPLNPGRFDDALMAEQ